MIKFISMIEIKNFSNDIFIKYFNEIFKLFKRYNRFLNDDFNINKNLNDIQQILEIIKTVTPYFFMVFYQNNFAGFVYLENFIGNKNQIHSAEITVCMKTKYWGKPTRECGREFFNYCFNILKLKKLKALVYKENERVISILKEFGFKQEGILKGETIKNGKLQDVIIYGVLR